jgi:hypothetical protein
MGLPEYESGDLMETEVKETDKPICPFCALPIEPWQEATTVNGERMHFDCYREKAGL